MVEEEKKELAEKGVEGPVFWGELEHVRPTANHEFPKLGAKRDMLFDELRARAEAFAQSNDVGRRRDELLEAMAIGSQSIGEDEGVASIVLGATHGMAVTETVNLLGIDGEDRNTPQEKRLDDSSMRFFDGDRDALSVLLSQLNEPIDGV